MSSKLDLIVHCDYCKKDISEIGTGNERVVKLQGFTVAVRISGNPGSDVNELCSDCANTLIHYALFETAPTAPPAPTQTPGEPFTYV